MVIIVQVEMVAGQEGETPGVCSVHINDALNVDISQGTQISQVCPQVTYAAIKEFLKNIANHRPINSVIVGFTVF